VGALLLEWMLWLLFAVEACIVVGALLLLGVLRFLLWCGSGLGEDFADDCFQIGVG
jgi:hypothetical protein